MKKLLIILGLILSFSLSCGEDIVTRAAGKDFKIIIEKGPVPPWATENTQKEIVENNPYETAPQKNPKKSEETVYVTRTGKKYHHKGCRYLKSIGGSFTVEEAEKRGYTPCKAFKP